MRERMELEIVKYNNFLLWGPMDKEACTQQSPELMDGAFMELLAPWRGYEINEGRRGSRETGWRSYWEVRLAAYDYHKERRVGR